jgi:hypothetical protein
MGSTSAQQSEKEGIAASPWIEIDGKGVLNPGTLYEDAIRNGTPTDWYGKVNSIELSRGYKPGKATLLMTRGDAEKLAQDKPLVIVWHDGDRTIKFHGWMVLRWYAIIPILESEKDAPVVVEFEDLRGLWGQVPSGYVRHPMAPWRDVLKGLEGWRIGLDPDTEDSVLPIYDLSRQFFRDPNFKIKYPEFPDLVPQQTLFVGTPVWRAWCAVLRHMTWDVVFDPIRREIRVIDMAQEDESTNRKEPLVYDYGDQESRAARLPNAISVWFPVLGARADGEGNILQPKVDSPDSPWYGWWRTAWYGWGGWWGGWNGWWGGYWGGYGWGGWGGWGWGGWGGWSGLWGLGWGDAAAPPAIKLTRLVVGPKDLSELKDGFGHANIADATAVDFDIPEDAIPTSATQVTNRTRERAVDLARRWLARHKNEVHRSQKHYAGVLDVVPDQRIHTVVWRDYGDDGGTITELHYGEDKNSDPPYLIEVGVTGRGYWQLAATPEWPKLHVSYGKQPRYSSMVILANNWEPGEYEFVNEEGEPQVGFYSGGAGLPAVLLSPPSPDAQEPLKLRPQEAGAFRIHMHGTLGFSDPGQSWSPTEGIAQVDVKMFHVNADGETEDRVVLSLARWASVWHKYDGTLQASAENVAGETIVYLTPQDWLEVHNASGKKVNFYPAGMVISRQDLFE